MFKDIDFVEFFMGLVYVIIVIGVFILPTIGIILENKSNEQIKQLEQNNAEQEVEKEYYINRCKMLEDLLEESGLDVDECECR